MHARRILRIMALRLMPSFLAASTKRRFSGSGRCTETLTFGVELTCFILLLFQKEQSEPKAAKLVALMGIPISGYLTRKVRFLR
jgi:hypothetical protein